LIFKTKGAPMTYIFSRLSGKWFLPTMTGLLLLLPCVGAWGALSTPSVSEALKDVSIGGSDAGALAKRLHKVGIDSELFRTTFDRDSHMFRNLKDKTTPALSEMLNKEMTAKQFERITATLNDTYMQLRELEPREAVSVWHLENPQTIKEEENLNQEEEEEEEEEEEPKPPLTHPSQTSPPKQDTGEPEPHVSSSNPSKETTPPSDLPRLALKIGVGAVVLAAVVYAAIKAYKHWYPQRTSAFDEQ